MRSSSNTPIEVHNKRLRAAKRMDLKVSDFIGLTEGKFEQFYTFEKKIGSGQYGSVYSTRHKATGQRRAVKMIKRSN